MGILVPRQVLAIGWEQQARPESGEGGPRATSVLHPRDVRPSSGEGALISVAGTGA